MLNGKLLISGANMKIEDLDKNFKKEDTPLDDGLELHNVLDGKVSLYGIFYDKERHSFARMPHSESKKYGFALDVLSSTTAGGRIRFSTDSFIVGVRVKWRYMVKMNNMPISGHSGFILLEETPSGRKHSASFYPAVNDENAKDGFTQAWDVFSDHKAREKKVRDFILYCPLYNDYVTEIDVITEKGAYIGKGKEYENKLPVVYYGSSITQGGCVSRPDNAYQAHIERWTNVDYINLGFSGNAKGEEGMAKYISQIPQSVFVCDYDHNAPSVKHLKQTHYNFYKTFREVQSNTPIIFLSRPDFYQEMKGHNERYRIVKKTFNLAKKQGDENVYFIDGRKLFGSVDREQCTADKCHPNDLGHYLMAKKIYSIIKNLL